MFLLQIARLKSRDPAVRRSAVVDLGQTPSARTLRLLQAMLADNDIEVRRLAVEAIAKVEDEGRVAPLLRALGDADPTVVQAAIRGLKRGPAASVTDDLVPFLKHPNCSVRGQAAVSLETLGWHSSNPEEEMWFWAAKGQFGRLDRFGSDAIPILESVLASGPSSVCPAAVEALGRIEDPRVLRSLNQALGSDSPNVCAAAVEALGRLGGPAAVRPIMNLANHPNAPVRVQVVEALGQLRAVEAVGLICRLLRDKAWEVRKQAGEVLGRLKDPQALQPLAQALEDADADVRETAATALGNLGERQAIGPLVLALKDAASEVRRIAAASLARLDPEWPRTAEAQGALLELECALQNAKPAAQYFVQQLFSSLGPLHHSLGSVFLDPMASPALKRRRLAVMLFTRLLGDSDSDLRQTAAESLGRLGDIRARPALAELRGDTNTNVREAVETALLALEPPGEPRSLSAS